MLTFTLLIFLFHFNIRELGVKVCARQSLESPTLDAMAERKETLKRSKKISFNLIKLRFLFKISLAISLNVLSC